MTNIQEEILKSQLRKLQNTTNLEELIKKLGILVIAGKPFIKKEGYDVKVLDNLEHDGKIWSAILTRKLK